jgi:hypothetical protein
MIEIRIENKLLVSVRQEMLSGDTIFLYLYQLCQGLYENRDKTVDVSFIIYLDRIGYSYLKAFYFADELPNVPFSGKVEFSTPYYSFTTDVSRMFDTSLDKADWVLENMKFGSEVSSLLR